MKKILSLLIIASLAFTTVSCGSGTAKETTTAAVSDIDAAAVFSDVDASGWYTDAVNWAVNSGIAEAAKPTEYGVNQALSKSEVLLAMWKAAGAPGQVVSAKTIADTDPDSDLSKALEWAKEEDLPIVNAEETLGDVASRYDAVYYMWVEGGCLYVTDVSEFDDAQGQDAVNWAKSEGITFGVGNNLFAGDRDVTKAMMVTFLFRAK